MAIITPGNRAENRQHGKQIAHDAELAAFRRFAGNPASVRVTRTAQYDLLGADLTKDKVCSEIVAWIDAGEKIKKVTLRGQHAGLAAFEMKPRINSTLYYLKVTLCELGEPDEHMLLVSAHPDH